jgi:hypothetical protein
VNEEEDQKSIRHAACGHEEKMQDICEMTPPLFISSFMRMIIERSYTALATS